MFEVYSKDNCQYCVKAKNLLTNKGEEFTVIDVSAGSIDDQVLARELLINRVVETAGITPRTMPQIFRDNEYVGGFDDLDALLKDD